MKHLGWFFYSLTIFLLPLIAGGDTLKLRNGDQAIGKIVSMNDQEVSIVVNGYVLRFYRADILEIIIRKDTQDGTTPPGVSPMPVTASPEIQMASLGVLSPTPALFAPPVNVNTAPQALLPVILPAGKAYQVVGILGRFRKGPGLDSELIDSLPGNTILMEMEIQDTWLHASTLPDTEGKTVEGWMHTSTVRLMDNIPCLVTGDKVQVREAADELTLPLKLLRRGDVVVKLEEQGEWFSVLCNNLVAGWCNKQFLTPMLDANIYHPPMHAAGNADLGTPILVERKSDTTGIAMVSFIIRDENCVLSGSTKLIVFHQDPNLFNSESLKYMSETIDQKDRLKNAESILKAGLPEDLLVKYNFVGADLLTLLGERIQEGWRYSLSMPDSPSMSFGFVIQNGPNRGTVIMVQ